MLRIRRLPSFAAVCLALVCAAPPAAAQITFAGVPWGAPADFVLARLDAAGWRHVRAATP